MKIIIYVIIGIILLNIISKNKAVQKRKGVQFKGNSYRDKVTGRIINNPTGTGIIINGQNKLSNII